jgi:hypothetical protein
MDIQFPFFPQFQDGHGSKGLGDRSEMKWGMFINGISLLPGFLISTIFFIYNLTIFGNEHTAIEASHKQGIKKMSAGGGIVMQFLFTQGLHIGCQLDGGVFFLQGQRMLAALAATNQEGKDQNIAANGFQQEHIEWVRITKIKTFTGKMTRFRVLFFRLAF